MLLWLTERAVKLSWCCIFLFFLVPESYGQESQLDRKISINVSNRPFAEVLEDIEKSADVRFSYSSGQIPADQLISIKARRKPIRQVLDDLLTPLKLITIEVEKQIIIRAMRPEEEQAKTSIGKHFTLSGYIRDKETGESMMNATVYVKEVNTGIISNPYGFYSLTLPEGDYHVEYSYLGYEKVVYPLELEDDQKMDIDLKLNKIALREVKVAAKLEESPVDGSQMSKVNLKTTSVKEMPAFLGEVEIVKSLQSLPGIKSNGDGSVYFYVRGGNKDQNLILMDEAPIYNPSHFFGFFSSFTPDVIKEVEVYKGEIPVERSGALSSLIDIRTKDGNMRKFGFSGSLGPLTARVSVEAPFKKDKASFFTSIRRSTLDLFIPKRIKNGAEFYFFDYNLKVNYKINSNNRLFLSIYTGKDLYGNKNTDPSYGLSWDNSAITLRYNHLYSRKIFSNTIIYLSLYNYYLYTSYKNDEYWKEKVSNWSVKNDFTFYPNVKNTTIFGFQVKEHFFDPGNMNLTQMEEHTIPQVPKGRARLIAFYASNEQKFGRRFSVKYGIRFNIWQNIGPTTVYLFDDNYEVTDTLYPGKKEVYNNYFHFEPRLSLKYSPYEFTAIKASYSRTNQFLQLLSNSTSPFTSLDVWMPSSPNIKPQTADIYVLGIYQTTRNRQWEFNVEGYYKKMHHQIEYVDHANMLLNPFIEGDLRFGKARSYGVETMIQRKEGRVHGWIAYTWSRTFKTINGINSGKEYPAFQDRPHDLFIYLVLRVAKRFDISANWMYASGSAITTPIGFYYHQDNVVPVYGAKNNDRLPPYHRLDISFIIHFNKNPEKRFQHQLTLSIFNVYARKNPISVNFNKVENEDGKFVIPANLAQDQERVATSVSLLGIIPSFTYSFEFK